MMIGTVMYSVYNVSFFPVPYGCTLGTSTLTTTSFFRSHGSVCGGLN